MRSETPSAGEPVLELHQVHRRACRCHLDLAAHEGRHGIQLVAQNLQPVVGIYRNRGIRAIRRTFTILQRTVAHGQIPDAGLAARIVELERAVDARGLLWLEGGLELGERGGNAVWLICHGYLLSSARSSRAWAGRAGQVA